MGMAAFQYNFIYKNRLRAGFGPPLAHSLSTSGLEESGWICPVQTSRQLPRVQRENNAPGITQGFLHFAHPARVQGSLDDLLPVKDNFWWVTPEFEIPAVLW